METATKERKHGRPKKLTERCTRRLNVCIPESLFARLLRISDNGNISANVRKGIEAVIRSKGKEKKGGE